MGKRGPKPRQWQDVFWDFVDKQGPNECWPWNGPRNKDNYGTLRAVTVPTRLAHRLAYILTHGSIPNDLKIRHSCDNPPCCNPRHLIAGTQLENIADMVERGRSKINESHWNVRLTDQQVVAIRRDPRSSPAIAAEYGVSDRHIRKIKTGAKRPIR